MMMMTTASGIIRVQMFSLWQPLMGHVAKADRKMPEKKINDKSTLCFSRLRCYNVTTQHI